MSLLTPPPSQPQRGVRAVFSTLVDGFVSWLCNTFYPQLVALVSSLNALAAGSAYSIPYIIDLSSTADADPTNGLLRFNASTQNAATTIYLDLLGSDGVDYTSILDKFDASTSTVKGGLSIVKFGDPTKFLTFDITARTTVTGYRKLTVVNAGGSSASPFTAGDSVVLKFQRTGDKGDSPTVNYVTGVLHVREESASGNTGGTAAAGGTTVRVLNTIKRNTISGASVSGNVITLPAGTYRMQGSAISGIVGGHQAYLYNSTDATIYWGATAYGQTNQQNTVSAVNQFEVVLPAAKTFDLRHKITTAGVNNDLGMCASRGGVEVYSEVFVEKLA